MKYFLNKRGKILTAFILALFPLLGPLATNALSSDPFVLPSLPILLREANLKRPSWSLYVGYDKTTNEFFHLMISERPRVSQEMLDFFLKVRKREKGSKIWKLTYNLSDFLKKDFSKVLEASVQLEGGPPLSIPQEVVKISRGFPVIFFELRGLKLLKKKVGEFKGKKIPISFYVIKDGKKGMTKAYLSKKVGPLGVVIFEGEKVDLYLKDWGWSFKPLLTGDPLPLKKWLSIKAGQ